MGNSTIDEAEDYASILRKYRIMFPVATTVFGLYICTLHCFCKRHGLDPDVLQEFPVIPYEEYQSQMEGLMCTICLTDYKTTDIVRVVPICNHVFHINCSDQWFSRRKTCPNCRRRIRFSDAFPSRSRQQQGPDATGSSDGVMVHHHSSSADV